MRFEFPAQVPRPTRNLNGVNATMTRYVKGSFSFEGTVTAAFGDAPNNQKTKFLFYGGGLRYVIRNRLRFEPWLHALAGGAHIWPQTALGGPSGFGYIGGGGFDYKLTGRLSLRAQADYIGTRFFNRNQNNFQIASGFVINF